MIDVPLPASVRRQLEREPHLSVVRAQQIVRHRQVLRDRGVPALNAKWIAP